MVTRGPYLQTGTPTSIVIRWRTDTATDSRVLYGTDPANLNLVTDVLTSTTEHVVTLTGLSPDTQYYYSVGSTTAALAAGTDYTFFTAPPAGTVQPTRVWVLGDSGTANSNAQAVRNAYSNYTGTRYTDLWLMLGDNAYNNGTDAEYQSAVFAMYPTFLRQTVLWPTIGNHDTAQSSNPPSSLPYFQIFTLPMNGEAGGAASGTEHYYSFDYSNIHFICLDSMASSRSADSPMLTWLQADISSTTKNWIIAFWHHPPYSKGSHDSDLETELIQMRQNALPILENYGVDLVLTGHSHAYERSYLLDGHYGFSNTLTSAMIKNSGSGREDGTGAYVKVDGGTAPHEGAVYAVAGSGGQTSGGSLNHPAMFISLNNLGSMVLDVNGNRLDAKFLRETGAIDDHFTIFKGSGSSNNPPTVSITSPADGATFASPAAQITISATASDDGSVAKVEFFRGATTKIGEDTTAPYSIPWSNVTTGTYSLTAKATDNTGLTATSTPVNITVNNPPTASITGPVDGATFTAPANIPISATANDGDGSVAKVEFFQGAVKLGEDTTAPYGFSWSNVPAGTYSLTAVATDNLGATATSAAVNVTVNPATGLPAAPTNLQATASTKGRANLNWIQSSSPNIVQNRIYRSTTAGGPYTLIQTMNAAASYSDFSVLRHATYYYVVTAIDGSGAESAYSNEARVRTK